jgi:hypothetical protein
MCVNVFMLNYKRLSTLAQIIESVRQQTTPTMITLWNNGTKYDYLDVDLLIESSHNLYCMPRWHMAAMLADEYIAIIDDDLLIREPTVFENCITYLQQQNNTCILGRTGSSLKLHKPIIYSPAYHREAPKSGTSYVDIINGRFMFLHASLLNNIPLRCPIYSGRGDDIWISLMTAKHKDYHHLPACLNPAKFISVGDPAVGLCKDTVEHYTKRDAISKQIIKEYNPDIAKPRCLAVN